MMYVMERSATGAIDDKGLVTRRYLSGAFYSADDFNPATAAVFLRDGVMREANGAEAKAIAAAPENKMIAAAPENKADKGVCPKCRKYIGRGVAFHSRHCRAKAEM